jgi:hypothetical protein
LAKGAFTRIWRAAAENISPRRDLGASDDQAVEQADMPQHATSTSFRPGQSGNPRGRTPGTQRRRTIEVRDVCNELIDDPDYRDALRRRLIAGTAGGVEILMWHYAKGKPVDRVETGLPGAFTDITNEELKSRLRDVLAALA